MSDTGINQNFSNELAEELKKELKEPDMYRVILHNDHYTTMEFVVEIIKTVFHKTIIDATKIMMDVHQKGKGIVGMYTYDIARTKIFQVKQLAEIEEFPLKCTMEIA